MKSLGLYLYTFALALWLGGMALFTFVLTPVIFKSFPRDEASRIVGKLFPYYFPFCIFVTALALILFIIIAIFQRGFPSVTSLALLTLAFFMSIYVNFGIYPEVAKIKKEVSSFETTSVENAARKKFRALHARSAVLNVLTILDGAALLLLSIGMRK